MHAMPNNESTSSLQRSGIISYITSRVCSYLKGWLPVRQKASPVGHGPRINCLCGKCTAYFHTILLHKATGPRGMNMQSYINNAINKAKRKNNEET
jgi:hypothetical protein